MATPYFMAEGVNFSTSQECSVELELYSEISWQTITVSFLVLEQALLLLLILKLLGEITLSKVDSLFVAVVKFVS